MTVNRRAGKPSRARSLAVGSSTAGYCDMLIFLRALGGAKRPAGDDETIPLAVSYHHRAIRALFRLCRFEPERWESQAITRKQLHRCPASRFYTDLRQQARTGVPGAWWWAGIKSRYPSRFASSRA